MKVVVIGAGIIGSSTAVKIKLAFPVSDVLVFFSKTV
jgi:glycine/D-amino acid oxidase-like deaminating enzyme